MNADRVVLRARVILSTSLRSRSSMVICIVFTAVESDVEMYPHCTPHRDSRHSGHRVGQGTADSRFHPPASLAERSCKPLTGRDYRTHSDGVRQSIDGRARLTPRPASTDIRGPQGPADVLNA